MANMRTGQDYLDYKIPATKKKKKKKKDDPSDYVGNFEEVMGRIRERKKSKIQNLKK